MPEAHKAYLGDGYSPSKPSISRTRQVTALNDPRVDRPSARRRSSCLWFQVFGVEAHSFLPDGQGDGCDLARQGETSQRRLYSFGEQNLMKLVEGASWAAGLNGRALKDPFEIVVVVSIESAKRHGFLDTS